jgi:hypothetical protein
MGLNLGTEYCCIETIKAPNWAHQMKNDINILLTFTNCVMQLTLVWPYMRKKAMNVKRK